MRALWLVPLFVIACGSDRDPAEAPPSSNAGSHRAAREAALDVVNDCRSRGFEIDVKRGGPACRHWVHYEVHCQDDSVAGYAKLVCDERDDFCGRPSDVCREDYQ